MPLSQIEEMVGFPPNSGRKEQEDHIRENLVPQQAIRIWLTRQGIPQKAAASAVPASLASAYVNSRYLQSWRNRVNPSWALLGGNADDDTDGNDDDAADELKLKDAPPAPAPAAPSNALATEQWLKELFAQVNNAVNKLVEDKLNKATLKLDDTAKEAIRTLARDSARATIEELAPPRVIEVHNQTSGEIVSLGLQHECFPILLKALQARTHTGFRLNIWLTGPTGSGKTSAAENAAKALSLKFGSDGSLDADYKVLGFRDANGNVVSTQFLDIYENGGIYVADEIDNWLPSALLSLNAALANGWVSSPRGLISRHKDACVIACANTWGLGATGDYVGRTRLDAASLDRFQPKIEWPIDEKLERAIAQQSHGADGIVWHDMVVSARRAAQRQGLKIIISPRATFGGIALLRSGFSYHETIAMTIGAGLSPEQQKSIGLNNMASNAAVADEVTKGMFA